MTFGPLASFVLGIVQGLTEFLPISSSAHLILIPHLAGWPDPGLAFDVALHLGTLTGVVVYFCRDLANLAGSWVAWRDPTRQSQRNLVVFLALATLPAVLAGLLLENYVETVLRSAQVVGWTLVLGGLALAAADFAGRGGRRLTDMTALAAVAIGAAQSLALVPGVSRSGATIVAGLALGFGRPDAAKFSFLLSIPVIAGAGALKAPEIWASPDLLILAAGFAGAALSGFLAIWGLLRYVQKHRFTVFVIYRVALGVAMGVWFRHV